MTTSSIDLTLFASTHPDIVKRTCISGLIFSVVMVLSGVLLFISIFEMHEKSPTISMSLMVMGTALILWGVFRLFWKSKEMVYQPTGSVTKGQSLFFDLKHLPRLTNILENGQFGAESVVKSDMSGNVRLDAMLSQDHRFAAVQLLQFVPYSYVPVTSVRYFTDSEAAAVSAFLTKCKME